MKQHVCESSRLVAFLSDTLSVREERELVDHLDTCTACGEELELLAASPAHWQAVKSHLSGTKSQNAAVTPDAGDSSDSFTLRQVKNMLAPTDDLNSMGRLGGYEVIGVVGSGAMGIVLKAVDKTLDRIVALKVMNPTLAACGTARQRFAREAKAAAGVLHPNVIAIHGVSTDRDLPYLVMPYISGTSLQQRMNRQGPLELVEILRLGSQIAAGLSAAHQKGLIHRDIKPSNVMLDEGVETAMITDFGLARTIDDATMTKSGAIAGTPEYMSPEQARGDSVDGASDIFSLGSLLYTLCTGHRPFRAKTSFGVMRKITDEEPTPIRDVNPDIPIWLCNLIDRMHAKTPTLRPSSNEAHRNLESCLAHVYQPDRIPLPKELLHLDARNKPMFSKMSLIGGITMMTVALITFAVYATQYGNLFDQDSTAPIATSSVDQESSRQPTVFKTLNLDFPNPEKRGLLKVDVERGFIEVTSHDQPGVVIEILTPPEYEKVNKTNSELSKIFSPKYDLDMDQMKNSIELDSYNLDFLLNLRIKVPVQTDLSLDAYFDGMEVRNVSGTVKARSQHSDIRLLDVSGSATAYSYNGSFDIRFNEVAENAQLDFETYNGDVNILLPQTIAATTAVYAGTGSFRSGFDIASIADNERPESVIAKINKVKTNDYKYLFGKINGGGIPIRIECQKGQIRIREKM